MLGFIIGNNLMIILKKGMIHMSKEINDLNKSLKNQLDLDKKQDKTDNNLITTDKTIVGAINELFQILNGSMAEVIDELNDISDIL